MMSWIRGTGLGAKALLLALGIFVGSAAVAEEKPTWAFDTADSEIVLYEAPQFHLKEYGWLLTFRLRVKSLKLVAPIAHVTLTGYDREEEEVWETEHIIRRDDYEAAYGGGRSQFVRVLLKDVPAEVLTMELSYSGDEEDGDSEGDG